MTGSWGRDLLDLFLPPGCLACGAWVGPSRSLVCLRCRMRLHEAPWPRCPRCHHPSGTGRAPAPDCLECRAWPPDLSFARYAWMLEGAAPDLVHALKYEGWRELAELVADSMARLELPPATGRRVLVPVPTTPRRLRERGYNQAGLIAERLAARTGLPCYTALERRGARRSQTALTPEERRENVRGAFRAAPRAERTLAGAHVLLIDDVLTTGATAGEAAKTLTAAGAARVSLLTLARALPRIAERAA